MPRSEEAILPSFIGRLGSMTHNFFERSSSGTLNSANELGLIGHGLSIELFLAIRSFRNKHGLRMLDSVQMAYFIEHCFVER
jgi:hypothetical protein